MKLLAIDTSSTACSVALAIDHDVILHHEIAPMQQAQKILPVIDELLKKKNIKLTELDALAFGCGPGSFTGVRMAVSVMQGLGYAAHLPLIPISSLAACAQAALDDLGWKKLLVAVDARIQEVYWGAYQANVSGVVELVEKELLCRPEACPIFLEDWRGVGNAWEIYSDQIPFHPIEVDVSRLPTATAVIKLAQIKYEKQEWVSAEQALPTYLRDEVARKAKS